MGVNSIPDPFDLAVVKKAAGEVVVQAAILAGPHIVNGRFTLKLTADVGLWAQKWVEAFQRGEKNKEEVLAIFNREHYNLHEQSQQIHRYGAEMICLTLQETLATSQISSALLCQFSRFKDIGQPQEQQEPPNLSGLPESILAQLREAEPSAPPPAPETEKPELMPPHVWNHRRYVQQFRLLRYCAEDFYHQCQLPAQHVTAPFYIPPDEPPVMTPVMEVPQRKLTIKERKLAVNPI